MKLNLTLNISIDINSPKLEDIIKAFRDELTKYFENVVKEVLYYYSDLYMKDETLAKLLNSKKLIWKSSKGNETTKILTPYGKIELPQLQVKDKENGRRYFITRLLLGIEKRKTIPSITKRYYGLVGSLATLRVVNKFLSIFCGLRVSLMTIVRSIRELGNSIKFKIEEDELNEFEADGTGLPINKAGKRGKELKVLAQRKKDGGIKISGMVIGCYKKEWDKLFKPLKDSLSKFKEVILITDGETSIFKGVEGINVIIQRCLFHIPHELKYTLWEDKVKRNGEEWCEILSKIYDIVNLKRIRDHPNIQDNIINEKKRKLIKLIEYCKMKKIKKSMEYLSNSINDIFSGIERKIKSGTTSLIERVMRTVNQRINVGKWSSSTALAVSKIRGAYYYNGFDI